MIVLSIQRAIDTFNITIRYVYVTDITSHNKINISIDAYLFLLIYMATNYTICSHVNIYLAEFIQAMFSYS